METRRKAWLAFLLSVPCPGLGHLYAGRPLGALKALGLAIAALLLLPVLALHVSVRPLNALLVWLVPMLAVLGIPINAALTARRAPSPYVLQRYNRWFVYAGAVAAYVGLMGRGVQPWLRSHWIEAFRNPTGSMEPALQIGDFLYVDKTDRARQATSLGSVVVFSSVEEPELKVMKRIVGLPGDTLAMHDGHLVRNGRLVTEPYVLSEPHRRSEDSTQRAKMRTWQLPYLVAGAGDGYQPDVEDWGPLTVPAGVLFVLGDNRDASYDSRYWGFVPAVNVLGRPRMIYWSFDPASPKPAPFFAAARWERFGQLIR